ncbi:MAG: TonB family protein [Mariprofundus sp.]|nr:TonB family protein [Mariprofundus sp.]
MFKGMDVRLMAAAVAAIGLHALLFILLPSSAEKMSLATRQGALQLELLAQQDEAPQKKVVQLQAAVKQQSKKQVKQIKQIKLTKQVKQTESSRRIESVHKQPAPSMLAITQPAKQHVFPLLEKAPTPKQVQHAELHQPVEIAIATTAQKKERLIPVAHQQPAKSERNSNKQGASIVPQYVQNRILAEVHYPKQARRHGWQGRAEFQFDVHQQSIQTVTLLASTGYPILDRAAHRGLIAASHVALSNGLYRMPVVFRLQ